MKRIVVVEDDRHVARLVQLTVEGAAVTAEIVSTGTGALERLARPPLPDAMLLDIMLPGLSGLEVLDRIRADERTAQLPVIILSARARPEDRTEALGRGASRFLRKPFDVRELARVVDELLGGTEKGGTG